MREVRIIETLNGYIVKILDVNSEVVFVFTDFRSALECTTKHLEEYHRE